MSADFPPLVSRIRAVRDGDGDRGFTLLEVLVSFVLFAIVAAGASTSIVSALNASHGSQQTVDAANVAQTFIASTQANTLAVRAEDKKTYSASVKNEQFTVTRTINFIPARAPQCTPGITFTVNVTVAQAQTSKFLARSDAVVTC
jgi:prepilin-type N-terminal cleavage/methylation domain-containing protein